MTAPKIDGLNLLDAVRARVAAEGEAEKAAKALKLATIRERLQPIHDALKHALTERVLIERTSCNQTGRLVVEWDPRDPRVIVWGASRYNSSDRSIWCAIVVENTTRPTGESEHFRLDMADNYRNPDTYKDWLAVLTAVFERIARSSYIREEVAS